MTTSPSFAKIMRRSPRRRLPRLSCLVLLAVFLFLFSHLLGRLVFHPVASFISPNLDNPDSALFAHHASANASDTAEKFDLNKSTETVLDADSRTAPNDSSETPPETAPKTAPVSATLDSSPVANVPDSGRSYTVEGAISSQVKELLDREGYVRTNGSKLREGADYVIYRAIGNDLPPRHAQGQTYSNTNFVLAHEPKHDRLGTRWYLNRIFDKNEELRLLQLLIDYNQTIVIDSIDWDEYAATDLSFYRFHGTDALQSISAAKKIKVRDGLHHDKNQFIMHNNQARNSMIAHGLADGAEYILPWDGNCFLSKEAWHSVITDIENARESVEEKGTPITTKYFTVPMARLISNDPLVGDEPFSPPATEEPQVIFHNTAKERFNEDMRYGRRPKVELLWRLDVKGPWTSWDQVMEFGEKKAILTEDIPPKHKVINVGWVARLFSGKINLEQGGAATRDKRGLTRSEGVNQVLTKADLQVAQTRFNFTLDTLMIYDGEQLEKNKLQYREGSNMALQELVQKLLKMADDELARNATYTVVQKPEPAPSGDVHDYLSVSPYRWPNPDTEDGIPYVRKDGLRQPAAEVYGNGSERYDRTRVANFGRNTTILALAGYFSDDARYSLRAAEYVRTWFLNERTRMNPNLKYAQMQFQTRSEQGSSFGILETIIFTSVLDAVRLLRRSGVFTDEDTKGLQQWFGKYKEFLHESSVGKQENGRKNNHGTLYDVQAGCVAAFVEDFAALRRHTTFGRMRAFQQFASDGSMPEEMQRAAHIRVHYMMYGFQAMMQLGGMCERIGVDMWKLKTEDAGEAVMAKGAKFVLPYFHKGWSFPDAREQDMRRMQYIYFSLRNKVDGINAENVSMHGVSDDVLPLPQSAFEVEPSFHTYFLVPQFWNLAMAG